MSRGRLSSLGVGAGALLLSALGFSTTAQSAAINLPPPPVGDVDITTFGASLTYTYSPICANSKGATAVCSSKYTIPRWDLTGGTLKITCKTMTLDPDSKLAPWQFDSARAAQDLAKQFGSRDLAAFGVDGLPQAVAAAGALLDYVKQTQKSALPHLQGLSVERSDAFVRMDGATRRNLELTETLRGEAAPTLLSAIDTTLTAMGARLGSPV